MPTESSHDVIILTPDLSTSHEESENWYQALAAAERGWSWGKYSVVSDDTGVFILLLRHFMQRRNYQRRCSWNLRLGIATS